MVYFTEVLIGLMQGEQYIQFLKAHVLGTNQTSSSPVQSMMSHPIASRIFRAIVHRSKKPADLELLLSALNASCESDMKDRCLLTDAITSGQHIVLNSLATACSQEAFAQLQPMFVKMLFTSFGHSGSKPKPSAGEDPLIRCVVGLQTIAQVTEDSTEKVNATPGGTLTTSLPGCLLAQTLFSYTCERPTILSASLCTQSCERLNAWARNPMLSRVLEGALKSESVSAKRKAHLLNLFEPSLAELACDRFGSRLVEALWIASADQPDDFREQFASKLIKIRAKLANHPFGHFVYYKMQLDLLATDPVSWRKRVMNTGKPGMKREAGSETSVGVSSDVKVKKPRKRPNRAEII